MKKFFTATAVLLLAITAGEAFAEAGADASAAVTCAMQASGTTAAWKNELGSIATITVNTNGNVTGQYKDGGSPAAGPLVGFCKGSAITFAVNWTGYPTITSWTGTWKNNKITTLWYLVNGTNTGWNNTNAGTDTFVKQ